MEAEGHSSLKGQGKQKKGVTEHRRQTCGSCGCNEGHVYVHVQRVYVGWGVLCDINWVQII